MIYSFHLSPFPKFLLSHSSTLYRKMVLPPPIKRAFGSTRFHGRSAWVLNPPQIAPKLAMVALMKVKGAISTVHIASKNTDQFWIWEPSNWGTAKAIRLPKNPGTIRMNMEKRTSTVMGWWTRPYPTFVSAPPKRTLIIWSRVWRDPLLR